MEWWLLLIIIFGASLILMLMGVPIAFSLGSLSLFLILWLWGAKGLYLFAATGFGILNNFSFAGIVLFVAMAEFILHSGTSGDAYDMLSKWLGRIPGGLAACGTLACTLFGAVCAASTATTAVIGTIALPEMLKRKYNKSLSTGSLAAGGALGALIPPSIYMIIYGTMVEQSIGKLFIGGIMPGLMLSGMFIAYIIIRCMISPNLAPPIKDVTWKERWLSLYKVWGVMTLIFVMLGSIYLGIATPTEIAGVGAFCAIIMGVAKKRLHWQQIKAAFIGSSKIVSFLCWIFVSATAFGYVLSYLKLPQQLSEWIINQGISPTGVIICINLILGFLGCIMDPAGMLLITTPIFFPVVTALGFDPIWYGVMFVVNSELAQITPPVGLNLFVMKAIAPEDITLNDIIKGAVPFMILDTLGIALIIIFPQIILWLPSKMT
jgi:C4-dicarboxylate transporter, DctM subunit